MCLNIGTTNYHHFPCGTNGKVVVLGVQILKHFRVIKNFVKLMNKWAQKIKRANYKTEGCLNILGKYGAC